MMNATYSPEDNKLRLYSLARLDSETYQKAKALGFRWAPKQEFFVAPTWTPAREDFLVDLCGEIGDEDTSLVERAEGRAERFEEYGEKRGQEAESARKEVSSIADNIPLGQPILIGHHSEKRARKDAERIQNGMLRAVNFWKLSQYWQDRAQGAIHHAKYKELPAVRARRIKRIEADKRKAERTVKEFNLCLKVFTSEGLTREKAIHFTNYSGLYMHVKLEGGKEASVWSALTDNLLTVEQVREQIVPKCQNTLAHYQRWIDHYENRLAYERAMLGESGGTVADQKKPEKGGACICWATPRGGWSFIHKVNKVSVSVLDKANYGERLFRILMPFDKLRAIMSKAEVDAARASGQMAGETETHFFLSGMVGDKPIQEIEAKKPEEPNEFDKLADTLRQGVKVVAVPQLFQTPKDLARRMVQLAGIGPGNRVLEPSAGMGALVEACLNAFTSVDCGHIVSVELNRTLADHLEGLRKKWLYANSDNWQILCADFLELNGEIGKFDKIIMNPPFENGVDIKHIRHAQTMLKPGGQLVALCANGPRQRAAFMDEADHWEDLPAGTFKEQGTGVNVALLVLSA